MHAIKSFFCHNFSCVLPLTPRYELSSIKVNATLFRSLREGMKEWKGGGQAVAYCAPLGRIL